MDVQSPPNLIGLPVELAEVRLREIGVQDIRRTQTGPPLRRQPAGEWRVLRCEWGADGTADLLVAQANRPHPTVQAALSAAREGA